jgi:hypothetical protein
MKTQEELGIEMDSIQQEYEQNAEQANFGALLGLMSNDIMKIIDAINDPNCIKRREPELINVESFVENYCSDFGAKAFLGYLLGLDEEYIISFRALIDFMHADFQIDSEIPERGSDENFTLMMHSFWPGAGVSMPEYSLLTDYHLDSFIIDYRVGKIKIDFTAWELLSHLVESIIE